MIFRVGKRSNTSDSSSDTIAIDSSLMKCSVYDSRGAQHDAEWMSAGTSSSQSFS